MAEPDKLDVARQRLASLNPDDTAYFNAFNIFINELIAHSVQSRNTSGLEEAISQTKQVLNLAPPGHYFHAAALCLIGLAFTKRFKLLGDASDLTDAVGYLESAVESCSPEQPLYLPFVGNLTSGLLNRYWAFGDVKDLDRIIETTSTALSASSPQSPYRDSLLNNLGTALNERFAKVGNRTDLDMAVAHYKSCLDLRPPGHSLRYSALGNLAGAMLSRFEIDGRLQDLENAASQYESALHLRSPGEEGYLLILTSLGIVYWYRYNLDGKVEELETAIGFYQTAMEHSKLPNLDHSRLLDNYGAALHSRYTSLGDIDDLDQAIQFLTISSTILPLTYSGRPITLSTLGLTHLARFDATSNIADLDSSIEKLASALQICTPGYPQRPFILSVYGRALSARFTAMGNPQDLDLAASMCKDAVTLLSPKRSNDSSIIASLTATLLDCFHRSGDIEECQTIINLCDRTLASMLPGAPTSVSLKINRAKAFFQRFQLGGEQSDIDICIAVLREVIPAIPERHTEHVAAHLQLGIALETRFKLGIHKDLDESIVFLRAAHRSSKQGSLYVSICMQLGNALREYYEYYHDVAMLDEAIVLLAEAQENLSLVPGHIDYRACSVNLGIALFMRFQAQRSRADLGTAIEHVSLALTLPTSREEFLVTFTLATFLSVRYTEDKDVKDLEQSVELFSVAAEQMPPKHVVRNTLCRNYGHALVKLGRHRDQFQHLTTAVTFFDEALELLPASHYDRPLICLSLADALIDRAKLLGNGNDLQLAYNALVPTIQALPEDDPMSHMLCYGAARLYIFMYLSSGQQTPSFLEESFQCYEKAARYTYAHSFMSVSAALEWVENAEKSHHSSALLAYQASLRLLYQHLFTTASIQGRHAALLDKHWIKQTGTLATEATSCAIARSELTLAVEFSEQGRGLLWSQLSQSRTPLDALRSAGDTGRALASDFERVSTLLAQYALAQDESYPAVTVSRLAAESVARRYRQLSKELEDVVAHIRRLEGFQKFLGRPSFESLQRAAIGGPVILVNISRRRCDAIIVLSDAPPRLVPLPDTSLGEITALSARFYHMLRTTQYSAEEKTREREVAVVLRTLWDTIVRPIVDELNPLVPRGARIWWCPTSRLTALPLHAAGPYRRGALNLPNIYVSSYTPTLAALIRARHRPESSPSPTPPAFVAIGQANPASSTGPALQTVSSELTLVESLLPRSSPPPSAPAARDDISPAEQPAESTGLRARAPHHTFTALDGPASTADAALAALSTHGWTHLACHGHPNAGRPFNAAFALADREVTVLDIVRARGAVASAGGEGAHAHAHAAAPGEFAFLSACHTAAVPVPRPPTVHDNTDTDTAAANDDGDAPEELIHLAAAMQFVGFRSVIGTLWAVDDEMVEHVVRAFYACMFPSSPAVPASGGEEGVWDCTRAARALNRAAKVVDTALVSLDQRIVFIHIGA